MEEATARQRAEWRFTHPFHRTVLARYKCSLDLYDVREDDCGGKVSRRADVQDPDVPAGDPQYFELRYGFRHLIDGRICVVAWLPEWERLPQREKDAWSADALSGATFADNDPTFKRWRVLQHEWVEAGPLETLKYELDRIRAITTVALDQALFASSQNSLLHYPIAENSAALLASLTELYRLVIDGLHQDGLHKLAKHLGLIPNRCDGTLKVLKSILPDSIKTLVHTPLNDLRQARNKLHRVPVPLPLPLPAFDAFLKQAQGVADAVRELRVFLSNKCGVDEEACVRRIEILESPLFPTIAPLDPAHADAEKLEAAQCKVIERVEIGKAVASGITLERDGIALHFTDGSRMVVTPMPNVGEWQDRVKGFKETDLHVRLDVHYVPSGKRGRASSASSDAGDV